MSDQPHQDFGLRIGLVVDDDDQERRGRVQVMIPGLIEPGQWAEVAMLGSPTSRGAFAVPAPGSQVIVGFLKGDLDLPVVLGGIPPPALSGGQRASCPTTASVPKMQAYQNEEWFMQVGHSATGHPQWSVVHRDVPGLYITLDPETKALEIRAPVSVRVVSEGMVQLSGASVQIHGRTVSRRGGPI